MSSPCVPARSVLVLHLAVALTVLVAACTSGKANGGPLPTFVEPPSTVPSTTLDYTAVDLGTVGGRNVVHVKMGPGGATLSGTVSSPTGPVGGGVVRVERVVDGYVATADVPTAADGTWTLPAILGGLFRVRAWRTPDLALTQPAIMFLAATDAKTLDLHVDRFTGTQVSSSIAPNPPIIGEPGELAVQVTTTSVDDQGVVRAQPKSGASVQLFGAGSWAIAGPLTQTASSSGLVTWLITCQALGSQALSVVVDAGGVSALNLPACAPVPTTNTTTTSAPPTSSTVPPTTTVGPTTTVKPKTTTTTAA